MNTIIGFALGPYAMGRLSDMFIAGGADSGLTLTQAIAWGQCMFIVTTILLLLAMRYLPADEASRLNRVKVLGKSFDRV
jgi:ABC-type lipoprotein release transport system permease subunit